MRRERRPCRYCGVTTGVRAWDHKGHCWVYRRWAGSLFNAALGRPSNVSGRERVTAEAAASGLAWDW